MNYKLLSITALASCLLASCGSNSTTPADSQGLTAEQSAIISRLKDAPEVTMASLNADERRFVADYLRPVKQIETVTQPTMSAQRVGCAVTKHSNTAKNLVNASLYSVIQETSWCSDGKKITSASKTKYFEIYAPLVKFNGWAENYTYGVGTPQLSVAVTGSFVVGTYGVDLINQSLRASGIIYASQ